MDGHGSRRGCVFAYGLALAGAAVAGAQPARQLTDLPGVENRPRYSPDGRQVAFDWVDGERQGISVVDRDGGRVTVVVERAGARSPAWSPDGRRLAFTAPHEGRRALWTVAVDGGQPELLYAPNGRLTVGPDWAPDGRQLGFTMLTPSPSSNIGYAGTIWLVAADGSGARELTTGGDEWWPRWVPSGDGLLYYTGLVDAVVRVGVDGTLTPISRGSYVGWRPAPSPDGRSLSMISSTARQRVWVAPMSGDAAPVVLTYTGDDEFPSWSPDGRAVAFSSDRSRARAWRLDLESGERRLIAEDAEGPYPIGEDGYGLLSDAEYPWQVRVREGDRERTVEVGFRHVFRSAWSPDGRWVVITVADDAPTGENGTYLVNVETRRARLVTEMVDSTSVAWCDAGTTFLFASDDKRGARPYPFRHVFLADTTGSPPRLWLERGEHTEPTDCRDGGRRIAYRAWGPQSGLFEARREGGEWQVRALSDELQGGGWSDGQGGRWSPDGERFAFVASRAGRDDIFIRNADGREERVTDDVASESTPHWTLDGRALLFSTREPTRDIWEVTVPSLPWTASDASDAPGPSPAGIPSRPE